MSKLPTLFRCGKPLAVHADSPLDLLCQIDAAWAIEAAYAARARRELSRMDLPAHMRQFCEDAAAGEAGRSLDEAGEIDAESCGYAIDDDGIACLTLAGVMTKRPTSWARGTSTVLMRRALRQAAGDERVKAIAIVVDSPGGQVAGTADLAADIHAIRGRKPIGAYIEDSGCSAAYWAASQCDFIWCNSTAQVGSIGTVLALDDTSRLNAGRGIETLVFSSGSYKGAGTDGAAVTGEQRSDFMRQVREVNDEFLGSVARARSLQVEELAALDGRIFAGRHARERGLVDQVGSIEDFFAALAGKIGSGGAGTEANGRRASDPQRSVGDFGALSAADGAGTVSGATVERDATSAAQLTEGNMGDKTQNASATGAGAQASVDSEAPDESLAALCRANGVKSADGFRRLLAQAELGRRYEDDVRSDAQFQAVRALGAELGPGAAASCEHLDLAVVEQMRVNWRAQADSAYGIGSGRDAEEASLSARRSAASERGSGAVRRSAGATQALPVNAEGPDSGGDPEEIWRQLSADERTFATANLGVLTAADRLAFARTALALRAQKGGDGI